MSHEWIIALSSFLTCVAVLPIVKYLATRWHVHDMPGHLKIHSVPIPRLGGIAIAAGLAAGLLSVESSLQNHGWIICAAIFVVWSAGLLDDLFNLSPQSRLVAQVIAGLLVSATPWGLHIFGVWALNAVATCLFVVVFVNSFNFLDGSDGVAGGVAGLVALGYAILYGAHVANLGAAIAWSLLSVSIGFLIFNFPPAKIFMGDSGSTLLGFLVAFLGLDFYRSHYAIGTHFLLPVVFAGLPLMDFLLAVLRRLRKRVSPFSGDRQHFYDLLLQKGWTARPVAVGAYAVTGTLLVTGWFYDQWTSVISLTMLCVTVGYLLFTAIRLGSLR
ncbi:MAG TPA: MraY family glycosyltransferase [Candidatus Acidoferrum sp.]|jgi:UDP-GlcNAc:undecaprenyl-phosphate GlcNAc-1-phosphate transferase